MNRNDDTTLSIIKQLIHYHSFNTMCHHIQPAARISIPNCFHFQNHKLCYIFFNSYQHGVYSRHATIVSSAFSNNFSHYTFTCENRCFENEKINIFHFTFAIPSIRLVIYLMTKRVNCVTMSMVFIFIN